MEIRIEKAYAFITQVIKAKKVANITGSPGIGKSDLIRKLAREFNLKVIDFRLAQADPTDLNNC